MFEREYIPHCFIIGVQVIFKGKYLTNLVTDNYRGFTLVISTFDKLFEILVWHRMKDWWVDDSAISELLALVKLNISGSTLLSDYRIP